MSEHAAVALPEFCPNCAHTVVGPFCSACGQKVHIETPTLFEFIHEYSHHYVAIDGTLTRTLWLLISRPGRLTAEFLQGRRNSYIKPLQLYVTISFIFFIALGFLGSGFKVLQADPNDELKIGGGTPAQIAKAVSATAATDKAQVVRDLSAAKEEVKAALAGKTIADEATTGDGPAVEKTPVGAKQEGPAAAAKIAGSEAAKAAASEAEKDASKLPFTISTDMRLLKKWETHANQRAAMFRDHPDQAQAELMRDMLARLPYGVFILMPIFALLLKLLFRKRHIRYGAHLVFSLHFHALVFLVLLVTMPLGLQGWGMLAILGYLLVAMRTVYTGRWWALVMREIFLLIVYSIFIGVVSLMLLAVAVGA